MNIISYAIGLNSGGGSKEPVLESISITANGTYTPDAGIDGYNSVSVNVPQDGAPPASALNLTGNIKSMFASGNWDWYIERYGNQITTTDLTSLYGTFKESKLSTIPFSLNGYTQTSGCDFQEIFKGCSNLTSVPTMTGRVNHFFGVFDGCQKLTTIPDSVGELDFTLMNTFSYGSNCGYNFNNCRSLRYIPKTLLKKLYGNFDGSGSYTSYYYQFNECYSLDALDGVAVQSIKYNMDRVGGYRCFDNCYRLKTIKFDTNTDGTPKTAPWNNQSLDLSKYVGYAQYANTFNGNYGFTTATQVKDATTYEALKNNADYWTADINYSRYNHDSAVETINSMPDTSAYLAENGGTNTIKFKGESGKLTDGGAINTLTEEEIAVAVAKGWTVSY